MSQRLRKLAGLAGILLISAYIAAFLTGFVCTVLRIDAPHTEFPLSDPQDLVVDHAGRIYVGVHFYSRVQQYAPDGAFLRAWSAPNHFHLRVDPAGELQVVDRTHVRTYTPDGRLIATAPHTDPSLLQHQSIAPAPAGGGSYEIRDRILFPRVVHTAPDGRQTTVIAVPWYKWPVLFPIPGIFTFVIGVVLMRLAHRRGQPAAPAAAAAA